jgi:hypothetical protein
LLSYLLPRTHHDPTTTGGAGQGGDASFSRQPGAFSSAEAIEGGGDGRKYMAGMGNTDYDPHRHAPTKRGTASHHTTTGHSPPHPFWWVGGWVGVNCCYSPTRDVLLLLLLLPVLVVGPRQRRASWPS